MQPLERTDVLVLGGGMAGLTLARHLLLDTERTVTVLERNDRTPVERQKVGESTVQLGGYYLSRVLDLEEHLFLRHFMKYNLRFCWKTPGRAPAGFEDCSQAYIRKFSNVASYQVDRNVLEEELLRLNRQDRRFRFVAPVSDLQVELAEDGGDHRASWREDGGRREVAARWVVDASGRARFLARRLDLTRPSPVDHGAAFCWVDGLLDVERLSPLDRASRRKRPDRRQTGHLPAWLSTNHFCGDGFWLWVIPLQGKTSLGLVFDRDTFPHARVRTAEGLLDWIREEFPFFGPDLDRRRVLGFQGYRSYSHDCVRTISPRRWAMTGEAGRFNDPLYSPGSDLIAIHNTLIVDAVEADLSAPEGGGDLEGRTRLHETVMRTVYEAYLPSYVRTYDVLGDREGFALKYTWELTVYFAFYVFPFLNDLFTDKRFALSFLNRFARLGPVNGGVQDLLKAYFRWKKERGLGVAAVAGEEGAADGEAEVTAEEPTRLDFLEAGPLAYAETAFYEVGLDVTEAKAVLGRHLENLETLARWTAAHVASVVLDDRAVLTDRAFVEALDPAKLDFDPEGWAERWRDLAGTAGDYDWGFDPHVLYAARLAGATFVPPRHVAPAAGGEAESPAEAASPENAESDARTPEPAAATA